MNILPPKWIRTNTGHAGRSGFIIRTEKGNVCKFKFVTYDGTFTNLSDSVNDLKKQADGIVTSHPDASLIDG